MVFHNGTKLLLGNVGDLQYCFGKSCEFCGVYSRGFIVTFKGSVTIVVNSLVLNKSITFLTLCEAVSSIHIWSFKTSVLPTSIQCTSKLKSFLCLPIDRNQIWGKASLCSLRMCAGKFWKLHRLPNIAKCRWSYHEEIPPLFSPTKRTTILMFTILYVKYHYKPDINLPLINSLPIPQRNRLLLQLNLCLESIFYNQGNPAWVTRLCCAGI